VFNPKFTITNRLLSNIKQINSVVLELNSRRFPKIILFELEKAAREISVHASTSIEGNPLPLTDVKRLLKQSPKHIRNSEQEVLNYNQALLHLKKQLDAGDSKLDLKSILTTHHLVTKQLLEKASCGKLRQAPVFVNDPRSRQTVFWPPDYQDVMQLLKDLLNFIKKQEGIIDHLILAGIFHKQFVLIHPFMDGNGRTVRLLTKLLLARLGLNTFNLFSFERYYNANVTKYFSLVGEQGNFYDLKIDFTKWLEYFTDGIIDELLRVKGELAKANQAPASGLKEHHHIILNYIKEHGSINDALYSKLVKRAKSTRALDFRYLLDQDLIKRHGKGKAIYYCLKR